MSNSLLTIDMITREAVALWNNSNAFIQNIDRQYDSSFAVDGAKIGQQLRIRLPNDYTVGDGPGVSVQDTSEQYVSLVVSTQKNVAVSFTSAEKSMKLDDFSERVLAPAVNNLAGTVASTIMQGSEGGVCNLVKNLDGSGNLIAPSQTTFLYGGVALDNNSVPTDRRKIVLSPASDANAVSQFSGLLNPAPEISRQYRTGRMKEGLGYEMWMYDQTVISHTTGTFSAGGTVNGAGQTGTTLTVNAITGTLNAGDIITIAGVNAVNRVNKNVVGTARQFVVLNNVANGGTSINIYPAIIPGVGGNAVQYQTVDVSPANGAAISLAIPASSTYWKNISFWPQAITMVTADLYLPKKGVEESARHAFDDVSLRMVTQYIVGTDQVITRLDVLFGFLFVRPEWACVIADPIVSF
jgi:hypothetical protein